MTVMRVVLAVVGMTKIVQYLNHPSE